jgi:protein-disulfide isomerase
MGRDPRAVRREILASADVQWDPGHENAIVKVVEFSDFQCPACKRGWATVKPALAEVGEAVRHGLVNFPLYNSHPWAFRSAVAGECIDSIWPDRLVALKEELYRLQDSLTVESVDPAVIGFLAQQGLDEKSFKGCYLRDPAIDAVLRQLELGYRLAVFGTPTYYANGEQLAWGDAELFTKRLRAIVAAKGRPEDAAEVVVTPKPTATATRNPGH